jgi:hypothetical protein
MLIKITKVEELTSKQGNPYKKVTGIVDGKEKSVNIYSKIQDKWEFLIEGDVVDLVFSEDRKWINDIIPQEKPPEPPQEAPKSKSTPIKEEINPLVREAKKLGAVKLGDEKIRSMCIAYSKDMACAKIIELKDIQTYANKFLEYIID